LVPFCVSLQRKSRFLDVRPIREAGERCAVFYFTAYGKNAFSSLENGKIKALYEILPQTYCSVITGTKKQRQ
jgi:hypothetical protein